MYTYKQESSMVYASKNMLRLSAGNTWQSNAKKKDKLIKLNFYIKRRHGGKSMAALLMQSPSEVHRG